MGYPYPNFCLCDFFGGFLWGLGLWVLTDSASWSGCCGHWSQQLGFVAELISEEQPEAGGNFCTGFLLCRAPEDYNAELLNRTETKPRWKCSMLASFRGAAKLRLHDTV